MSKYKYRDVPEGELKDIFKDLSVLKYDKKLALRVKMQKVDDVYIKLSYETSGGKIMLKAEHIDLYYCSTVNKAQGSQWDNIYFICDTKAFPVKNKPYTAITRASKSCTVIDIVNSFTYISNCKLTSHDGSLFQ